MSNESETAKTLYEQHGEQYRHQDKLMWGRFQLAAIVEGAVLYGVFQIQIEGASRYILIAFGAAFLLLTAFVAAKDGLDAWSHLQEMRAYETSSLPGEELAKGWNRLWKQRFGYWCMIAAFGVLMAANVFLLCIPPSKSQPTHVVIDPPSFIPRAAP